METNKTNEPMDILSVEEQKSVDEQLASSKAFKKRMLKMIGVNVLISASAIGAILLIKNAAKKLPEVEPDYYDSEETEEEIED